METRCRWMQTLRLAEARDQHRDKVRAGFGLVYRYLMNLAPNHKPISASASASLGLSTTSKPDGILGRFKDIFKEGKEILKGKKDDKSSLELSTNANANSNGGSDGSIQASGSASFNPNNHPDAGGTSSGGSGGSGLFSSLTGQGSTTQAPISGSGSASASGSLSMGGSGSGSASAGASIQINNQSANKSEGAIDKMGRMVNRGTEAIKDTVHRIEDKAHEVGEKVQKAVDEHLTKPMQSVSGSGQMQSEGKSSVQASAKAQLKGDEREQYLEAERRKQESEMPNRPNNLKDIINQAKARGVIPQNEDRSALRGNHADEKSMTVDMYDKAHEISKIPVEKLLKPIDKMLGYEKDPLVKMYDNSHEILRRPLSLVAKPVESVLNGAFKTTDEAKKDSEKILATASVQEQREAKMKMEKERKEARSVVGQIADKTLELATKPIEIVLKPIDHALGLDKDNKKNPLIQVIDEIYSLSKKPVDTLAKPFENILKKMGDEPVYQVSIRFNATEREIADPKLFTRLADGALNIADRVLTKPLELVMKPLDHALGYDEPGKKNPIVEAAHSLKNATKVGVELFTRPIDRIIKELADIGASKPEAEREAELERQKEQASRLVRALDMIHQAAQAPFEIVLRPVSRVLGMNKDGRKEPLLRAWDVIHQVVRTPIQIISRPVEDALLGEPSYRHSNHSGNQQGASAKASFSGSFGGVKADARFSMGGSKTGGQQGKFRDEHHKNVLVDGIKRVEKMAVRPFEVMTSPLRRLILGEDNEKVGSETEKNNREIQAKARGQLGDGQNSVSYQLKDGNRKPDKIMSTLEKINDLALKPLEELTQPISELIEPSKPANQNQNQNKNSGSGQSKPEVKGSSDKSSNGGGQVQAQAKIQTGGSSMGSSNSGQRQQSGSGDQSSSASASAQIQLKKN